MQPSAGMPVQFGLPSMLICDTFRTMLGISAGLRCMAATICAVDLMGELGVVRVAK